MNSSNIQQNPGEPVPHASGEWFAAASEGRTSAQVQPSAITAGVVDGRRKGLGRIWNHRFGGAIFSLGLHVLVFGLGTVAMVKPVEYGIEAGTGGLEVSLVAAPAEVDSPPPSPQIPVAPLPTEITEPETAIREPLLEAPKPLEAKPVPTAPKVPQPVLTQPKTADRGDGSSTDPGRDATTFASQAGAVTSAKPNYLKNPAPTYPLQARQKGWQGTVMLEVFVDVTGRPTEVRVQNSSGFELLDTTAVKAVRKWRFHPAKVGPLPVESRVVVPIRFKLDS